MVQAFVLNNVAYAAKVGGGAISGYNEVDKLAPGAIAIFADGTNAMIDIASAAGELVDIKGVRFAIGKKNGGAQISQTITRNRLTNYQAKSYAAGAAQVVVLGNDGSDGALNLPTLVSGMEYGIYIQDESAGGLQGQVLGRQKFNYSGVTVAGSTAATILADIIAQVNADENCPVTAALIGSNVGISFTCKKIGTTVALGAQGIFEDATRSVLTNYNIGVGTSAQILEVLDIAEGEFGRSGGGLLTDKFWKFKTNFNSATTYDTYIYHFDGVTRGNVGQTLTNANEVILYMPVSATIQANFQAAMGVIFGTDTSDAIESGDDTA